MVGDTMIIRDHEYVWHTDGMGDCNLYRTTGLSDDCRAYITSSRAWGACEKYTIRMRMPVLFTTFCHPPLATTLEEAKQIVENAIRLGADQ